MERAKAAWLDHEAITSSGREAEATVRFYAKLGVLSLVFVALSWLSGAAGRTYAKEWYFAARCQIAVTLSDGELEQRLLDEARQELRNAGAEALSCADAVAVAMDGENYLGR